MLLIAQFKKNKNMSMKKLHVLILLLFLIETNSTSWGSYSFSRTSTNPNTTASKSSTNSNVPAGNQQTVFPSQGYSSVSQNVTQSPSSKPILAQQKPNLGQTPEASSQKYTIQQKPSLQKNINSPTYSTTQASPQTAQRTRQTTSQTAYQTTSQTAYQTTSQTTHQTTFPTNHQTTSPTTHQTIPQSGKQGSSYDQSNSNSIKCQPFQGEKNGKCYCNNQKCNEWKSSHLCTSQTLNGECICDDQICSKQDQRCSELTIFGECVQCRQQTQQQDCLDHQVCHQNTCVCLDYKCLKEGLVCERQYSKNSECVTCRKDQQCSPHERCSDEGLCVCSKSKCQADGLHCSDQDIFGDCVSCNTKQDCLNFQMCSPLNQCICDNLKCPEGTFCSNMTSQGLCQQCLQDDDCDQSFQNCTNNICTCNTKKCGTLIEGSVCTTQDECGRCSECMGDSECDTVNDEICVAGRCECTDENCETTYPDSQQFCLDEATGPCVECRKDENCQIFEICTDEGECVCSDDKCADSGEVCGPFDTCVECTTENTRFCNENQQCMGNSCVCDPTLCPSCQPMCSPMGACVECLQNSDCDESFQVCNSNACTCVQSQCQKIDPDANCVGSQCVQCGEGVDCTVTDQVCVGGFCVCNDDDCAGDTVCKAENTGPCVQCRTATQHCDTGFTCNEGTCQAECPVQCSTSDDCTVDGEVCVSNVCVCMDDECETPGQVCQSNGIGPCVQCVLGGNQCTSPQSCQFLGGEPTCACDNNLCSDGLICADPTATSCVCQDDNCFGNFFCTTQDASGMCVQCTSADQSNCDLDYQDCQTNMCTCIPMLCQAIGTGFMCRADESCTQCQTDADCKDAMNSNDPNVCIAGTCVCDQSVCDGLTPPLLCNECGRGPCVECLVEGDCPNAAEGDICNDAGQCVCSNDKCGLMMEVCNEDGTECVQCTDANQCMCEAYESCNVSNMCQCDDMKCPAGTACNNGICQPSLFNCATLPSQKISVVYRQVDLTNADSNDMQILVVEELNGVLNFVGNSNYENVDFQTDAFPSANDVDFAQTGLGFYEQRPRYTVNGVFVRYNQYTVYPFQLQAGCFHIYHFPKPCVQTGMPDGPGPQTGAGQICDDGVERGSFLIGGGDDQFAFSYIFTGVPQAPVHKLAKITTTLNPAITAACATQLGNRPYFDIMIQNLADPNYYSGSTPNGY